MKTVVSISLGSSKRNKSSEIELLGKKLSLSRVGTDGDLKAFGQKFIDLDGKVDALGVGGADIWVAVPGRRYAMREIVKLASGAKKTPVVDGSGLKHTLERDAVGWLQSQGVVDFKNEKVLLVSAVDRFGLAQAVSEACPSVVYGDFCFGLGIPIPLRRYRSVEVLGRILLPIVTQMPIKWLYPTGEKQEERAPRMPGLFQEATFIAGDWHYIRRYAPNDLSGKTVMTQTIRSADLDLLRGMKARRVITTTPVIGGESFATNVMEAALVALSGEHPLTPEKVRSFLNQLGWTPQVIDL